MKERLQKIISGAGITSRRAAETLINEGRVRINGEVATLGMSADLDVDEVTVDGVSLSPPDERMYIMLNKPRGFVTTLSDEKGRRDVTYLIRDAGRRLYPVGRLDMYSDGLLIMTDDGHIANMLMHPSHNVKKTYQVLVRGDNLAKSVEFLRKPMDIDGREINPAGCEIVRSDGSKAVLNITIAEGRNRQVRKMCDQAELNVLKLTRISEGELKLGDLPSGKWRNLTTDELKYLRSLL